MINRNRREFLADVGRGMLLASVGPTIAADLGLAPVYSGDEAPRLSFGDREPLVGLFQETPADKLLPLVVEKLKTGTNLANLVAAAALANARTFGGEDYTGYHAFMALMPSYQMAVLLPVERQPLPVLKVLYRNTSRIQECGGRKNEVLHPVTKTIAGPGPFTDDALQKATRQADMDAAEGIFAAMAVGPIGEAYRHLQFSIQDEVDVHRVVLAWRAWVLLDLAGRDQAHTLLRQSVRYCVKGERGSRRGGEPEVRTVLPKLLDQYHLVGRPLGTRDGDDGWLEGLADTIYSSGRAQAAGAVAAALAEGMSPEAVGEAISLAANRLVLCDRGRTKAQASPGKPEGSVHGASVGVHASDAANAWRNIARVSDPRNIVASLIVGAYHTGGQSAGQHNHLQPSAEHLDAVKTADRTVLLGETESAIKGKDQARACALVQRYVQLGGPPKPVFELLLNFAVSEDGALHAEKYYRTVTEEFAATRPAFRWRQLVALARVTASEYGYPAPGYVQARELLKV
jgi:hypothetical protein